MSLLPNDPQFGPVLSGVIWFCLAAIGFLVATVPFSSQKEVQAGIITALVGLCSLAIQKRGKIDDRRRDR